MSTFKPAPSETVTDPAAIAATIQALSPAFKTGWRLGFEGLACDLPDCVVRDVPPQHLEDFNEGHRQGRIARAKRGDDGSPSMLAEPTRTIMAGNGVIEQVEAFDEMTGPIDPGAGIVEKCHGNPVGEIAHAVIVPPKTLSSSHPAALAGYSTPATSRSIGVAGVSPHSAAPKAAAGGEAFRLSDNQRASIRDMAIRATASGNFDVLCLSIESLVLHEQVQQLGRTIERVDAAVQGAFAKADSTVREVCRDAKANTVARCNACPRCGNELEYTPAERGTSTAGGYDCSDPDCGYSCGLDRR